MRGLLLPPACIVYATQLPVAQTSVAASTAQAVTQIQQQHPFRQTRIADCTSLSTTGTWNGNSLHYVDGDLTIQGVDRLGRHYSIVEGTSVAGCSVWSASLDGSGSPDLEIVSPGVDSSGGYDATLTVVLFDPDGRPFPWQATGKFTTTDNAGVDQVVAGSADKGASVVVPTKEGLAGLDAGIAFDLYSFAPSTVVKVSGSSLGANWPMTANATADLIQHRQAESLALDLNAAASSTQFAAGQSASITGGSSLVLANGSVILPPAILVQDAADASRTINLDPTAEDIGRVIQSKARMRTAGTTCEEEECRPMVLIATP